MERTFRPKGSNIKAVQINADSVDYAVDWCFGKKIQLEGKPAVHVPSFDEDALFAEMGDYLILVKGQGFRVLKAGEFEDRYEPVKTTRSDT